MQIDPGPLEFQKVSEPRGQTRYYLHHPGHRTGHITAQEMAELQRTGQLEDVIRRIRLAREAAYSRP